MEDTQSKFTGGAAAECLISVAAFLMNVCTLSLAYPALMCWKTRWTVRHTILNGRPLVFDGKARQLYGKYLLWLFFSVLTLGIYYLFAMRVNLLRWQTKHTRIAGETAEVCAPEEKKKIRVQVGVVLAVLAAAFAAAQIVLPIFCGGMFGDARGAGIISQLIVTIAALGCSVAALVINAKKKRRALVVVSALVTALVLFTFVCLNLLHPLGAFPFGF